MPRKSGSAFKPENTLLVVNITLALSDAETLTSTTIVYSPDTPVDATLCILQDVLFTVNSSPVVGTLTNPSNINCLWLLTVPFTNIVPCG